MLFLDLMGLLNINFVCVHVFAFSLSCLRVFPSTPQHLLILLPLLKLLPLNLSSVFAFTVLLSNGTMNLPVSLH